MKAKAFSYVRFSTPTQAKGHSKERQYESTKAYCAEHNLDLATDSEYTFFDSGLSGYKGDHVGENGELARFLKMVEANKIPKGSYLIVENLDRLGRETVFEALHRFSALLKAGIKVVTLSDRRTYDSSSPPMEVMYSVMEMGRAHEESRMKALRLGAVWKKKKERAREEGVPIGRAAPLWLEYVPAEGNKKACYHIREDRADIVRRIFQWTIDGYGKAVIAKMLNAECIPAFKDGTWSTSSVGKILSNKATLGQYQPFTKAGKDDREPIGEPIEHYYPAVIDEATFYAAKAAIDGRRVSKATKQAEHFNVWQGIVRCAICDAPRHLVNKGKPPKGYRYLVCSNSRKGLCKSNAVRLEHAEAVFPHLLLKLNALPLVQDSATKITHDLGEVEGKLAELRKKYEQFSADYIAHPSRALASIIEEADRTIAELEQKREGLLSALSSCSIMNWSEFVKTVPLESTSDRSKANTFLKRLNIQVRVGKGYFVTQGDIPLFVLAYLDGKVGMLQLDETEPYTGGADTVAQQLLNLMARNAPFVTMSSRITG